MLLMSFAYRKGFTLIEALVAILVLSFGLLGVAAMQVKALQSAHMGFQRSLASLIATDAQERAWAYLAEMGACPTANQVESGWGADPQSWLTYWQETSGLVLQNDSGVDDNGNCAFLVSLTWQEERFLNPDESVGDFLYSFDLPN